MVKDLSGWLLSEYNENTNEQLDYYLNPDKCNVGDAAYLYSHEDQETTELEILKIVSRSEDPHMYDKLLEHEDILLDGEALYEADTSAEFISDNNSYLVWFKNKENVSRTHD